MDKAQSLYPAGYWPPLALVGERFANAGLAQTAYSLLHHGVAAASRVAARMAAAHPAPPGLPGSGMGFEAEMHRYEIRLPLGVQRAEYYVLAKGRGFRLVIDRSQDLRQNQVIEHVSVVIASTAGDVDRQTLEQALADLQEIRSRLEHSTPDQPFKQILAGMGLEIDPVAADARIHINAYVSFDDLRMQYTVGIPLRSIYTFARYLRGVSWDRATNESIGRALSFANLVAARYAVQRAGGIGVLPGFVVDAWNTDEAVEALRSFMVATYLQVAARVVSIGNWRRTGQWSYRKNFTGLALRTHLSRVRAELPEPARAFLEADAAQIRAQFNDYTRSLSPEDGEPLMLPFCREWRLGDYLDNALLAHPAKLFSQDEALGVRTNPPDLDHNNNRLDPALVLAELRFVGPGRSTTMARTIEELHRLRSVASAEYDAVRARRAAGPTLHHRQLGVIRAAVIPPAPNAIADHVVSALLKHWAEDGTAGPGTYDGPFLTGRNGAALIRWLLDGTALLPADHLATDAAITHLDAVARRLNALRNRLYETGLDVASRQGLGKRVDGALADLRLVAGRLTALRLPFLVLPFGSGVKNPQATHVAPIRSFVDEVVWRARDGGHFTVMVEGGGKRDKQRNGSGLQRASAVGQQLHALLGQALAAAGLPQTVVFAPPISRGNGPSSTGLDVSGDAGTRQVVIWLVSHSQPDQQTVLPQLTPQQPLSFGPFEPGPSRLVGGGQNWMESERVGQAVAAGLALPPQRSAEAVAARYPWLSGVNPFGFTTNCVLTVIAVDSALGESAPYQAGAADLSPVWHLQRFADGRPLLSVPDYAAIVDALTAAPVGARGVVVVGTGLAGVSHAFVAVRDEDGVVFLDGQTGRQAVLPSGRQRIRFLPTGDVAYPVPGARSASSGDGLLGMDAPAPARRRWRWRWIGPAPAVSTAPSWIGTLPAEAQPIAGRVAGYLLWPEALDRLPDLGDGQGSLGLATRRPFVPQGTHLVEVTVDPRTAYTGAGHQMWLPVAAFSRATVLRIAQATAWGRRTVVAPGVQGRSLDDIVNRRPVPQLAAASDLTQTVQPTIARDSYRYLLTNAGRLLRRLRRPPLPATPIRQYSIGRGGAFRSDDQGRPVRRTAGISFLTDSENLTMHWPALALTRYRVFNASGRTRRRPALPAAPVRAGRPYLSGRGALEPVRDLDGGPVAARPGLAHPGQRLCGRDR